MCKTAINMEQQNTSSVMYYNLYPSEYYVIHNGNSYTKHVYMDGERVATLLGSDNSLLDNYSNSSITLAGTPFITGNVTQHYAAKRTAKEDDLINSLEEVFGNTYGLYELQNTVSFSGTPVTDLPYYFHRDHLGSTALVTDSVGNVDHRIEYTPDGSLFFQTVTGNYRTPYRFNAKEFDDDTELYYFGARYYDKNLGIWISPDPMTEDYPGVSPYAYCHGNPVNRIDLWGMDDYTIDNNGYLKRKDGKDDTNAKTLDRIFAGKKYITINKSITKQLMEERDNYNGNYAILSSKEEAGNIFKFFADNTNVEWGLQKYNINGNNIIVLRTSHSNETLDGLSIYSDGKLSFLLHSHPKNSYSYNASGDYKAYNRIQDNGKIDCNYFDGDLIHLNNVYLRYQKSHPSYPLSKYPKAYVYYAGDSKVLPHIFEYNLKRSRIKPMNISTLSQIFNYIKK